MKLAVLKALGLHDKAGQVYLATLNLGTASVQQIAKTAGLNRSSTYAYITELLAEGLLEKIPLGKKDYYHALDPTLAVQRARTNVQAMEAAVADYQAHSPALVGKPKITMLEGARALQQTHHMLQAANSIRFWSDLAIVEDQLAEAFDQLSLSIHDRQIRTREIIADTPPARRSAKRYAAVAGKYYTVRLATTGTICNNSAIFGNTILLFRLQDQNLFVICIDDNSIADTFKALFDMAWQAAKPFIPK